MGKSGFIDNGMYDEKWFSVKDRIDGLDLHCANLSKNWVISDLQGGDIVFDDSDHLDVVEDGSLEVQVEVGEFNVSLEGEDVGGN